MGVSTQTARAQITQAKNVRITNLSIATPNVESSHSLITNLKHVTIRSEEHGVRMQFAFVATESGTKYFTIPKNTTYDQGNIDFSGKTLYIQANATCNVQILEFY